jgi:hypothetical protein
MSGAADHRMMLQTLPDQNASLKYYFLPSDEF